MRIICDTEKTEVLAYLDVFEIGDEWIKIKGCEGCHNADKCCGNCPMLSDKGCFLHSNGTLNKPYRCVVNPTPDTTLSWCQLEFKCIKGTNEGKIKRINKTNPE